MQVMKVLNIFILSLMLILVSACGNSGRQTGREAGEEENPASQKANLGEAPDFKKTDLEGQTIRLSDFKDKVVLLNFWATWCGPCRREIPALIKLQQEFNEQLVIIGIALDEEGFDVVRPYAEEMNINYPIVTDDYSYGEKLGGIYMVPTTYIIDRQGFITARKIGEISIDDIRPRVEKLFAN